YCKYMEPYGPGILPAAQIIYPCMQVAAVLCQKADIWLFSMDKRDIIMLTRDYCEDTNRGNKPTIFLHSALPNLLEDPEFQNSRHPGRTIFMLDEEKEGNGSNRTYSSMKELIVLYESGDLDSFDVKLALRKVINDILELVGEFFHSNKEAQAQIVPHRVEIGADVVKIQMQNEEMSGHLLSVTPSVIEYKPL
ncbi:hypothetical protein E2562_025450, partial [Oryza meyeriana var. granulata]